MCTRFKTLMAATLAVVLCTNAFANEEADVTITQYYSDGGAQQGFVDPATVGTLIKAGVAVKKFLDKRKQAKNLAEMKNYLKNIDSQVKSIKRDTTAILKAIEQLPTHIDDAIRKDRLDSAYRKLDAFRIAFYQWEQDQWDIGAAADLINAYNEIAELDVSQDRTLNLIEWGEMLLILSRGSLTPFVLDTVTDRRSNIEDLILKKEDQERSKISSIQSLLKSGYFSSHKVDGDYEAISTVNRVRYKRVSYQCNCRTIGRCHDFERCDTCYKKKVDGGFANRAKATSQKVQAELKSLKSIRKEIAALKALRDHVVSPYIANLAEAATNSIADDAPALLNSKDAKNEELIMERLIDRCP